MAGLEYDSGSTAFVSVSVTDVDEVPEFSLDILDVTVPENITVGATLLTVEAKDPEGKEIGYTHEPIRMKCDRCTRSLVLKY